MEARALRQGPESCSASGGFSLGSGGSSGIQEQEEQNVQEQERHLEGQEDQYRKWGRGWYRGRRRGRRRGRDRDWSRSRGGWRGFRRRRGALGEMF